jgi:excisionase family DNA binding protein
MDNINIEDVNEAVSPTKKTKKLLTMSQVAERWQVSIETVKRRIRSGQLPALKLGRCVRVSPTCLVAYENNRKLKP